MKPIVLIPNAVLTQKSQAVIRFDKKLAKLVNEMKETLVAAAHPRGVGLAAPQIGVPLRIFVARETVKTPMRVFINPVITKKTEVPEEKKKEPDKLEGCLSVPKIWGVIERAPSLEVRYQDETGLQHTETVKGFLANIVQHEVDHLEGILFTQRVLEQNGQMYQTVIGKDGKETLEEMELK